MRRVEQIMGIPISIDIPCCDKEDVYSSVFAWLREIDAGFSTYIPGSEVSKFRDGELKEENLSNQLKAVINACRDAESITNGYFSAWADGQFDPSGYVKGWAIAQAGKLIENNGYETYCIAAGGDILAASKHDKIWQIAVQDPTDKHKILNKLSIKNGAVATSGSYERGAHIINPKTKQPAEELLSVTIIGNDIITADVLATACFAMGNQVAGFMKDQIGYEALIIPNRRNQGSNR